MKFKTANNLYCFIYGHNYYRLEKATKNTPQLICKNCKQYFTYNKQGEIIPVSKKKKKLLKILKKI